ncbi:MAG: hypothetical protein IH987_19220, partial [Planctomycetes bacterium]|nr:hypothetical protein [Planctomycetota bacterium]
QTLADDLKFGGSQVDTICWNTGFFAIPCCSNGCAQNVDDSWEVRIYEENLPGCDAIPGAELGRSTLTVLNKIEGTGQGTATWLYSGRLNSPVVLPNGGPTGKTYWMEVSGFGEPECAIHATHSRDHGNDHHAIVTWTQAEGEPDPHVYNLNQIGSVDLGLCEDSGLITPDDVLGACCTCSAGGPGVCAENFTQKDCVELLRGVWVPCGDCTNPDETCPGIPDNDDCETPYLISNIPTDGSTLDLDDQNNICATDDGPSLAAGNGGCASSLPGDANMHDDIWYRWDTGSLDCGSLTVNSCGDTDTMDQMISVYLVPNGGQCPLITEDEIGCGDDTCGIGAGPSTVTVDVVPNRTYLIRVGGWNVEVPGGFFGSPRGRFGLHFELELNCEPVSPPVPAVGEPDSYKKNRYISVDPSGELGNNPTSMHIRVEIVSTEINDLVGTGPWWATDPVNGAGLSPATCISVVKTTQPENEPDWSGCPIVHLTGCPIAPTTTYSLRGEAEGSLSTEELLIDTQAKPGVKWAGDVVGNFTGPNGNPPNVWTAPNGTINIDDAVAGIKTLNNPTAVNATHLSVTDVHPVLNGVQINLQVNINDVLIIILGFQGAEYGVLADPGDPPNIPDLTQCP